MNPYAAPQHVGNRARKYTRAFPLLIRDSRRISVGQGGETLERRLRAWAAEHGFAVVRRAAGNWVLRRALNWKAFFAWHIRDIPTHVHCRLDATRLCLAVRLVCRHDWAYASRRDPERLALELDGLAAELARA